MHNKEKYTDIEQTFMEQAWRDMRQQLDTEMPEKRRRRPIFWLFWGMGLSALCVAVGFWMQTPLNEQFAEGNLNKNKIAPSSQQYTPHAEGEVVVESFNENRNDNLIASTNSIYPTAHSNILTTTQTNKKTIKLKEPTSYNPSNTSNTETNLVSNALQKTTPETIVFLNEQTHTDVNLSNKPTANKNVIRRTETQEKKRLRTVSPAISVSQTNPLVILPLLPLSELKIPLNSWQRDVWASVKPKLKWQFGVELGVGQDLNRQLNGHIGAYTSYQLRPKWSLESGLYYYHFAKREGVSESDAVINDGASVPPITSGPEDLPGSDSEMFGGGDTTEVAAESYNVLDVLEQHTRHALVMPIQVNYSWRSHWQSYAAMRLAYVWIQKGNTTVFDISNNLNETATISTKNQLELWSKVGLRYQLRSRWALDVGYNYAWSKNKLLAEPKAVRVILPRHHFLEASVRFHF